MVLTKKVRRMDSFLTYCTAAFAQNSGVFSVFFLAGLAAGFTHCLLMCGPIVAASAINSCAAGCCGCAHASGGTGAHLPLNTAHSQLSYHFGRLVTYGAFGFLVTLLARQLSGFVFWPWVSAALLCMAGIMFLNGSLGRNGRVTPLNFAHGVLLGFMPCGMLYAALMMAATLPTPLDGLIAMILFTMGTMPALLMAGLGAHLIGQKWRNPAFLLGRAMMAFNGISLLVMATRTVR